MGRADPHSFPFFSSFFIYLFYRGRSLLIFEFHMWIDGRVPDWQDEHPPAPSSLRVLYLGKILQDDETLARMCIKKGGKSLT
jgi:hypothetical protein